MKYFILIIIMYILNTVNNTLSSTIIYYSAQLVTSRSFNDDVIIQKTSPMAGSIAVTFIGSFQIAAGKTITVGEDCVLMIENSTLTCNNGKWNGIRMQGQNPNGCAKSKYTSYLSVKNSTLNNARVAIRNIIDSKLFSTDEGGSVYVDNSIFNNNGNDIEILRNSYGKCALPHGIYNSTLNYNLSTAADIEMASVVLIESMYEVIGNTFNYVSPTRNGDDAQIALFSGGSSSTIIDNEFKNSDFGVVSKGPKTKFFNQSLIFDNVFNNFSESAILLSDNPFTTVKANIVNDNSIPLNTSGIRAGIRIEGSYLGRNFNNKVNNTSNTTGSVQSVGMFLNNLGTGFNTVENPSFSGFIHSSDLAAVYTTGMMRNTTNSSGLFVECGDFTQVNRPNMLFTHSVREHFGTPSYDPLTQIISYLPAGNRFSLSQPSVAKINNSGGAIQYYHNDIVNPEQFPDWTSATNRIRVSSTKTCRNNFLKMGSVSEEKEPQETTKLRLFQRTPCGFEIFIPRDQILVEISRDQISDFIGVVKGHISVLNAEILSLNANPSSGTAELIQEKKAILSGLTHEKYKAELLLVNDMIARESIGDSISSDSIISRLSAMHQISAEFMLCEYFASKQLCHRSIEVINGMSSKYPGLSSEEVFDYAKLKDIYHVLLQLSNSNRRIHELTASEISQLELLANLTIDNTAKLRAQYILRQRKQMLNHGSTSTNPSNLISISAFPNPANHQFEISNLEPNQKVEIYSLAGNLKYSATVPMNTNQLVVNSQSWNLGIYYIHLYDVNQVSIGAGQVMIDR